MEQDLAEILPLVTKPIRYTGGEYNIYVKEPEADSIYFGLLMPEVYEIGMSNYGLKILRSLLHRQKNVIAERAFAPWLDFGEKLKSTTIPLFSLESKKPLKEFNILGFSLQSELSYPNILYMLDLAGITFLSKNRTVNEPLIIAGGPCTVNPLPIQDYIDLFVIGDGEESVLEIVNVYENWNRQNRQILLDNLSKIKGVYVPLLHNRYDTKIYKRTIAELKEDDFPYPPLVPICEIVHDRLTVEISRGCTRGCRFCQAGFLNRPVRMRSVPEISRLVERGLRASGWEEISLLSLSTSDYPNLPELIAVLQEQTAKRRVAISLPSMRGEDFNLEIAERLAEIKKTGLTFAPETISPKLRAMVNKDISEEKILNSIVNATALGWRNIKLYFMIGLPGESTSDLDALIYFLKQAAIAAPRTNIKYSLSPFIPKPHTPLQWCQFEDKERLKEKTEYLKSNMRKRNTSAKWENPDVSYVQAILARGDEKLNPVIAEVYKNNGIFQDWTEKFDINLWQNAFKTNQLLPNQYLNAHDISEPLDWDFINTGVNKDFLRDEYQKALNYQKTPNCAEQCSNCGIEDCPMMVVDNTMSSQSSRHSDITKDRSKVDSQLQGYDYRLSENDLKPVFKYGKEYLPINKRFRLKYVVGETFRYAGHLDLVRTIYRALRRSELPITYSQGFTPHPIVSFGPPLPVGVVSTGEYIDIEMVHTFNGNIVRDLGLFMPRDIRIEQVRQINHNTLTLGKSCNLAKYLISSIPWKLVESGLAKQKQQVNGIYALEICSEDSLQLILYIAPKVKLFGVLQELFMKTDDEVRLLNIERKDFYVLKNERIFSPMEEE